MDHLARLPLYLLAPMATPTHSSGRCLDMVFCNHAFANSFTCACVLGPEVLSTDHRSLLLGLSARVVQGDGVPRQAPEHHLTTFRVGCQLWSNPRIAGCALDMIFPLMCLVPSA